LIIDIVTLLYRDREEWFLFSYDRVWQLRRTGSRISDLPRFETAGYGV